MRKWVIVSIAACVGGLLSESCLVSASTAAAWFSVIDDYAINPILDPIPGNLPYAAQKQPAISSHSFSRIGLTEDSQSHYGAMDLGMFIAHSESLVQTSQGKAAAGSRIPNYIATSNAGQVEIVLNESVSAQAGTMTFTDVGQTQTTHDRVFAFSYECTTNIPSNMQAQITFYTGYWDWQDTAATLILAEKDGWANTLYNTPEGTLPVLSKTYTAGSLGYVNAEWNFQMQQDRSYSWFTGMVVELTPIPEPTGLVLLGLGGMALLRRKVTSRQLI